MFALLAFGYLFGFVGLLIAIPLAASLGVILRFAMRRSLAGPNIVPVPVASGGPAPKPVAPGRGEIGPPAQEVPSSGHREAVAARRAHGPKHESRLPSPRPPHHAARN
jgi:hypothetical protein